MGLGQGHLQETILHFAPEDNGLETLLALGLHSYVFAVRVYPYGQSLAESAHVVGHALALRAGRCAQFRQSVGQDVDGVFGMLVGQGLQSLHKRLSPRPPL